jgi:mannose-6-phosphate isomerase-like protein (cupin superfamily)
MKGFKISIESAAMQNNNFRKVLYTSAHSQLVLMCLKPMEEIGLETHRDNDQFFRIERGNGKVIIDNNEYTVKEGDGVVVPAGAKHNVINTSNSNTLNMYTIYSPAHHKDAIIRITKKEAEENEEVFDGKTSEL